MGVAYKPDISDERESPALKIMDEVAHKGGEVLYHDPYVSSVKTVQGRVFSSSHLTDELLAEVDCVVITTKHTTFDFDHIKKASLIIDLQNAYRERTESIYKL